MGIYFATCVFVISFTAISLSFVYPPDFSDEYVSQTESATETLTGFRRTSGNFSAVYIMGLSVAWLVCPGSIIYMVLLLRKEARDRQRNERARQNRRERSPVHRRRVYSVMDLMAVDEPMQDYGQDEHYM